MTMNEMVWAYSPKHFDLDKFKNWESYGHAEHEDGRKSHSTNLYKAKFHTNHDIWLYWSICPTCSGVRTKKIIGYNCEDGYNIAHVRELARRGEIVGENQMPGATDEKSN